VDDIKKVKKEKENTKAANSPHWGGETSGMIAKSFVLLPDLMDIFNCANCGLDWPRGSSQCFPEEHPLLLKVSVAHTALHCAAVLACD
jgi:hypothetical protein